MSLNQKFITDQRAIIVGTAGMVLNLLFIGLAMVLYPGYDQVNQTISKLVNSWPSALLFSIGVLIGSLAILFFLVPLDNHLRRLLGEQKATEIKIIKMIFLVIFITMVGVVIFPSTGSTSDIHDLIAVILFVCIGINTSWISKLLSSLTNWPKALNYLGYAITVIIVILGLLLSFWEYGPIFQKIATVAFAVWLPLTTYYLMKYQ